MPSLIRVSITAMIFLVGLPALGQVGKMRGDGKQNQSSPYRLVKYLESYKNIYRVNCEYPFFTLDSPLHREANQRMRSIMRTHLPSFLAMRSLSQRDLRRQAASGVLILPHTVRLRSKVGLVTKHLVSFAVDIRQFTGGATEYEGGRYYVNLFMSGRSILELRFSDIFLSDYQTIYAVKTYLDRKLQEASGVSGYYGYRVNDQALDSFILLPDRCKWILAHYHFGGSRADGPYEIEVPYDVLRPIMQPEWIEILLGSNQQL